MTRKIQSKHLMSAACLAFTAMFVGACTTSREPVSMVEPSYSHIRDVASEFTGPSQLVTNDLFTNDPLRETSNDRQGASSYQPASVAVEMTDEPSALYEPSLMESYEPTSGDYMFEMAQLAGQRR